MASVSFGVAGSRVNVLKPTFFSIGTNVRFACPCCGYPTLAERSLFEICELCNWEDDGQGDEDADEVLGGPNGDCSLTEARENFKKHRDMYDGGNVDFKSATYKLKGQLMAAFDRLYEASPSEVKALEARVLRLEAGLSRELLRRVRKYERQPSGFWRWLLAKLRGAAGSA